MKNSPIRHLWVLLLPLLLLLGGILDFPFVSSAAQYSDAAISHYPNALFLRRAIIEWRTIPLWSPAILSGYPFAANPLSGLWYPPGWLAIALPLPFGFNLLVLLHMLWAGVGMYCFLRSEGFDGTPALLGALAFEATPKLFAHYGAGHLSLVYAVCWSPWLLLASRLARQRRWRWGWALPGVVLATIFLADVRWAAYAGICWAAYLLLGGENPAGAGYRGRVSGLIRNLGLLAGWTLLAALLAAPLALPLLEYTQLSTRADLSPQQAMIFSLPPSRLLGLFYPDPGGAPEWVFYPGWAVLSLALLALVSRAYRSRAVFWAWVAGLSTLFAFGDHLPVLQYLANLPLLDLLRVPPRALFLEGFALAVLAAYGLQSLSKGLDQRERYRGSLLLFTLASFSLLLAVLVSWLTGSITKPFVWGGMAALISGLWIGFSLQGKLPPRLWVPGLFVLCLLDLFLLDAQLFASRPAEVVLGEGKQVADFLQSQPGSYRTYSPSYSLPQQTAALYDIRLAEGVDPLQLRSYTAFMRRATGIPTSGYSVTLPPFANGNPRTDNESYLPEAKRLGLLNIRFVLAEYDLEVPGLELATRIGTTRVYANREARSPAWVQPSAQVVASSSIPINQIDWSPNRITVHADGPGLLVLSEIIYPGWVVRVDGSQEAMQTVEGIFRAVEVDSGSHEVVFEFNPWSVYAGLACFASGVGAIILGSLYRSSRAK